MSKYFVTKTFNPNKGYSCTFRNWRAKSHCRHLHGYDLVFQVTFECAPQDLTPEGWVVDFGALGPLKDQIEKTFDHTLLVAEDDPFKDEICALAGLDVANIVVLPRVGCEAFSLWLAIEATTCLEQIGRLGPVAVRNAVVYEHGANQGGYIV